MKKRNLIIMVSIVAIAAIGTYGALHYMNRSVASISGEKEDMAMTPAELLGAFVKDEQAANALYLDKIILVEGKINEIKKDEKNNLSILLDTGDPMSSITCNLEKAEAEKGMKLKQNDVVKIKGVCSGMLMDVVMVNCAIESD